MKATEHQEAVALMKWVELARPAMPGLLAMYHIPNGGARNAVTGAMLKAEGVMPGVADYHLPVARGGYHSLYIELKAIGGRQSQSQKVFELIVKSEGNQYVLAHGAGEAIEAIMDYLSHD